MRKPQVWCRASRWARNEQVIRTRASTRLNCPESDVVERLPRVRTANRHQAHIKIDADAQEAIVGMKLLGKNYEGMKDENDQDEISRLHLAASHKGAHMTLQIPVDVWHNG